MPMFLPGHLRGQMCPVVSVSSKASPSTTTVLPALQFVVDDEVLAGQVSATLKQINQALQLCMLTQHTMPAHSYCFS